MKRHVVTIMLLVLMGAFCTPVKGAGGTVLREKKIREAITAYIMERTNGTGLEIRIKRIVYSGDMSLPSGKVSYEFMAPRQWEGWGRTNLGFIVRVDDSVVRNMSVPVEVEALADMVVALRPLVRGEIISEGDVALQKRDLAGISGKVAFDTPSVVGKVVRINIRGNSPVRSDFLEKVPIIKYGQMVTIVAEDGSLRVTAAGRAKGSAAEGDLVMVQNLNSKKDVQGRVLDSGTVAVDF
ncbi:MAG: flagellar basal body P-ring formation chaperone FlgA [Geobacteraceae bacterium]|nr:flagellar basal body P-ring formation chaperone FlgA [Geobacteraceae bacterium]